MLVNAINNRTGKEHSIEITAGIKGLREKNIHSYIKVTWSFGEIYNTYEELFNDWEITSHPILYKNYTGQHDFPELNGKYIELSGEVIQRSRDYALKKLGV